MRFTWAVKDKEKFSELIRDVSYFVGKLNAIIPDTQGSLSVRDMTLKDLKSIHHLGHLQLVLEAAKEHDANVATLAQRLIYDRCKRRILNRLWYRKMKDRKQSISIPHYQTFRWALNPPVPGARWDSLAAWLRSGTHIYWVSGKAGSGKSTLMKHLSQHRKTKSLLEEWVDNRILIQAEAFFPGHDNREQRSLGDVQRGLLYDVVHANPSLIPKLLPSLWKECLISNGEEISAPSMEVVKEAFTRMRSQTTGARFCFFIDGLDECSGDRHEAISFIKQLASGDAVKVVISSRPVPECVDAFTPAKKLILEDLTRGDVQNYIHSIIGSHKYMEDLRAVDSGRVKSILQDLTEKAMGVFLWVVLACRSLLDGFACCDYPEELQRRADELPTELEDLFRHMLGRIEPRYQKQAAKMIRVCYERRANDALPGPVYTLGLALVDQYEMDVARQPNLRYMSLSERQAECRVFEARLRSRCCGLLEVRRTPSSSGYCFCGQTPGRHDCDRLVDSTVEFMHLSLFEFLSKPGVWDLDCLKTSNADFEPHAVLARIDLHLTHILWRDEAELSLINKMMSEMIVCSKYTDAISGSMAYGTLRQISRISFSISKELQGVRNPACAFFHEIKRHFETREEAEASMPLLLAIEAGMVNVVRHLDAERCLDPVNSTTWLIHATTNPLTRCFSFPRLEPSLNMVPFILSKECDSKGSFLAPTTTDGSKRRFGLLEVVEWKAPHYTQREGNGISDVTLNAPALSHLGEGSSRKHRRSETDTVTAETPAKRALMLR